MKGRTVSKYVLKPEDYIDDAQRLGCERAALMAVAKVESNGTGFYSDGHPTILFEGHIFHRLTKGKFDLTHPTLSYPKWTKQHYGKTSAQERARLEAAAKLDRNAALMSTSWGTFQILGLNYVPAGFRSLQAFINAMFRDANSHLEAFTSFILNNNLDDELRDLRWADFARHYNGPGYAANKYDVKMAEAYQMYKRQGY